MAENFSQTNEGAASGQVSVLVVDGFKTIHIEKGDAERALGPPRTIQFRFHHADQPAIVGKSRERITYCESTHLIEQTRLIQESAAKHHDISGRLAQFSQEKRAIQQMTRK